MRHALAVAILVAGLGGFGAAPAIAATELRAHDLRGCWEQVADAKERALEKQGFSNQRVLCLKDDFSVDSSWVGGAKNDLEGMSATGAYSLAGGRLFLRGPVDDGWIFTRVWVNCDAAIADKTLSLTACIGAGPDGDGRGPERLADVSYTWLRK